jgi:excisionase family DNA binding protein
MKATARFLNVGQAAEYLGVSAASLRNWSNRGLVATYRTPGGQRRYDRADLDAFMHSMREPVSANGETNGANGGHTGTRRDNSEKDLQHGREPVAAHGGSARKQG